MPILPLGIDVFAEFPGASHLLLKQKAACKPLFDREEEARKKKGMAPCKML